MATANWLPPKLVHPIGGPIELPQQFSLDGWLSAEQLVALAEIACLGSRKCPVVADTLAEMAQATRKSESFIDVLIRAGSKAGYIARMTPRQYELFRHAHGLTGGEFAPPALPGPGGKLTVFLWRFPDRLEDAVPDFDYEERSARRNASKGARPNARESVPLSASEPPSLPLCAPGPPPACASSRAPALRTRAFDENNDDHQRASSDRDPPAFLHSMNPRLRGLWSSMWDRAPAESEPIPPAAGAASPSGAGPPTIARCPEAKGAPLPPLRIALDMVGRLGGPGHDDAVSGLWVFLATELGVWRNCEATWRFRFDVLGRAEGGRVALREILTATWRKARTSRAGYLRQCLEDEASKWPAASAAQKRTPGTTRQCSPGVRSGRISVAVSNSTQERIR